MHRKILLFFAFFLSFSLLFAQKAPPQYNSRILLIPLDDRPPCLQFPVKMGLIGDVEIVTPPRELLGRFTDFGKSDAIIDWLKKQKLKNFDAVIISFDMLAYGGLVASRVHETPLEVAKKRLEIVGLLKSKAPKLKIYGSSVIMRLAPTGDGKNEAYREKLAKWAELSAEKDTAARRLTADLERQIPAEALKNYQDARARNVAVNILATDLVRKKVVDYLILSQDDAKPKGLHINERKLLTHMAHSISEEKIALQPGADEVSMLLLARALSDKYQFHPRIKAVFSSDSMANLFMPYEDRPLSKTVSFHIKAVGATEVTDEKQADIVFYVFTSRFEKGAADKFLKTIENQQKPFIIADVDPKGDVQGGDIVFTEGGISRGIFTKIDGYACWNTAGNTIGTALPHGMLAGIGKLVAKEKSQQPTIISRMAYAQKWFIINRLLDDFTYHSRTRPKALALIKENKWSALRLTEGQAMTVKKFCLSDLQSYLPQIENAVLQSKQFKSGDLNERRKIENLTFELPWSRTFEAEIDFELKQDK